MKFIIYPGKPIFRRPLHWDVCQIPILRVRHVEGKPVVKENPTYKGIKQKPPRRLIKSTCSTAIT